MRSILITSTALLTVFCLTFVGAIAQQSGIKRTDLQTIDFPGPDYVTESFLVTIAPQADVKRHTHPGVEMGYLISGRGTLSIEGNPERTVKAGDSWAIPAGTPHALRNAGNQPEQIVVTYVVKKNEPLASSVP